MKNQASIQLLKVGTPINPNADTGHIMLCADADGNLRIFGENGVELPIGSAVDESRLLPTGGKNGNILECQEGVDRGNNVNTKLLLQPATSDGQIIDSAYGNEAPVGISQGNSNSPVTVENGESLAFSGSAYLTIAKEDAAKIITGTNEWCFDVLITPEWSSGNAGTFYLGSGNYSIYINPSTGNSWMRSLTEEGTIGLFANETHLLTLEQWLDGSTWKLSWYCDGVLKRTNSFQCPVPNKAIRIGRGSDNDRDYFKGKMNNIRFRTVADHRGAPFAMPPFPFLPPAGQPVWAKGIDRSRLLPENPTNGDIACFDADVVTGSNDETVKFLLQPVTSNKELVDSAYGNPTKVVINNHGLTVDDNGTIAFTTSTYGIIAAGTLPADVLVHDKPWVIDLLMKLDEGQWSGTELVYFGREGSVNFWFQWTDNYKFECNYDGNWNSASLGNLGEEHLVTLEYYQDSDSNWYAALYLDGTFRQKKQVSSSTDMRNYDLYIGRRSSGKSLCSGQFKAIRIRAGAPYKGQTFTPDEFPYQEPQTVGEWGKFNISSLVKSVNGQTPDENGNVVIETSDGTLDLSNYSGALKLTVPTGTFSIGDSSGNFINTVGTTLVLQGNEKVQLTAYNADTRHTLAIGSDGLLYDDHAINTASGIVVLGSDGKLPALDGSKLTNLPAVAWGDIPEKPETFPASAHNHAITDVTGLEDALQNAGTVKSVNGATPDSSGAVTLPEATASAAGLMAAADKAKLDGISTSEAWYTVADAAAITLDRANGELQKVTLTQNCVLTAPVLDADHSTLLLQVTSSSAVTVTVGETNIVTDHTGTFQVGWYWDGEATRRYPAVEIS